MQLAGVTVLVTGGSSGIGRVTAERFTAAGAHVVVTGRDEAALQDACKRTGGRAIVADLADPAGARRVAEQAGDIDVLVNNAGIGHAGAFADMDPGRVDALLDVDLRAVLHLTRLLLPGMLARRRGALVFVTSIAGLTGVKDEAVYAATKAAVHTFADSLRPEVSGRGVSVSTVAPGVIDTPFFARRGAAYARSFPRPIAAARVADAIVLAARTGRAHQVVPRWLGLPARLRGGAPGVYRSLEQRFGP